VKKNKFQILKFQIPKGMAMAMAKFNGNKKFQTPIVKLEFGISTIGISYLIPPN
jgi:hypothetical protein